MTPDQASANIAELAQRAYEDLLRRIRAGETPRAAADAALAAFRGPYYQQVADTLSVILKASLGPAVVKAWPVGNVKLSQALYAHHRAISAATAATVNAHLQGLHSARDLAKTLYEGYDFKPDTLKVVAKLPKYLRVKFDQAKAATLKTPALRAAYLQAVQAAEAGAGQAQLEQVLKVAFYERNRYLANRIARTEIARAQNAQIARELLADDQIGFVQIRLSSKHPKPDICDLHAQLDAYGLGPGVYPKAEAPLPPFHPHCLPGDALITASGRITAVSKRRYDGDMVVITTAAGQKLAATVNHPVLTPGGWIAIGALQVGDQVLGRVGGPRPIGADDQHQHMPTRIADIADAFLGSRQVTAREVPTTAPDFHGDGMAGQIAVIGAYRQLWNWLDARPDEAVKYDPFMVAHAAETLLGERILDLHYVAFRLAAHGGMGGFSPFTAEFGRRLRHFEALRLADPSGLDAPIQQALVDYDSAYRKLMSELEDGSSGQVFVDDVISIEVYTFHGLVFNLETEQGHYTSNNIITHNCYCLQRPILSIPPTQKVQAQPNAARAFLKGLPPDEARQVMGGRERLRRVLEDGDSVESVVNTNVDPLYHARRMGEVGQPVAMPSPQLPNPIEQRVADAAQRYTKQLESLPFDDAITLARQAVNDPLFRRFFEEGLAGNFPVGVLRPEDMKEMGTKARTVLLSARSLKEHLEKHPEIQLQDYQKIPLILDQGEVWQAPGKPERLIYLFVDGVTYRAALKRTLAGDENYFLTLFKNTKKKPPKGAVRVR